MNKKIIAIIAVYFMFVPILELQINKIYAMDSGKSYVYDPPTSSCSNLMQSQENSLNSNNIIFLGTIIGEIGQNKVLKINKIFKAPVGFKEKIVQVSGIFRIISGYGKINDTFIVYGNTQDIEKTEPLYIAANCTRKKIIDEQQIKYLEELKNDSYIIKKNTSIIFQGRLIKVIHRSTKSGVFSEAEFDIEKVFYNSIMLQENKIKTVKVFTNNCDNELRVNMEYIWQVKFRGTQTDILPWIKKDINSGNKPNKLLQFNGECYTHKLFRLHEKKLLEKIFRNEKNYIGE